MANIYESAEVKVFLTSVTIEHENGEITSVSPNEFVNKIAISCSSNPIIKLNKLTTAEIRMWTNIDEKSLNNKTNEKKRKSENSGYMTRSKKQKMNDEKMELSVSDEKSNSENSASRSTKRNSSTKRNGNTRPKIVRFREATKRTSTALMPTLHRNELIWAYIKGFPAWPAVIEDILSNGRYTVHFFGDHTRATVTRRNIMNYYEGFHQFSSNFGNIKLCKAIEEAKFFLLGTFTTDECWVCEITKLRQQYAKSTGK